MKDLEKLFADYVDLPLECDGLTRVLSYLLDKNRIRHQVMRGTVSVGKHEMAPHFWIELPDGRIVDYRARMWLGNSSNVPHGVFNPEDFSDTRYNGKAVPMKTSEVVFQILTRT